MYEKVNGLHIIMTELDERLDQLRTSCPADWSPVREEIKSKVGDLGTRYEEASKELFDYDIGG